MRTGTELGAVQGRLLFPLPVLEPFGQDGQARHVLCASTLLGVWLCPVVGASCALGCCPLRQHGLSQSCLLPLLQKAVFEDVPLGTVILSVTATDADSGQFALIQYSLGDGEGKFGINPNTVRSQPRLEQSTGREGRLKWSQLVLCSHTSPSAPS